MCPTMERNAGGMKEGPGTSTLFENQKHSPRAQSAPRCTFPPCRVEGGQVIWPCERAGAGARARSAAASATRRTAAAAARAGRGTGRGILKRWGGGVSATCSHCKP